MRFRNPEYQILFLLLAFSCCFSSHNAHTQTLLPELTTFSSSTYNSHSQIACSEPLPDGRMVFGTAHEALIHDGETFRQVPVGSGKIVFSMEHAPDGRVFVGGQSLMGVIRPDSTGSLSYRSFIPLLPDSLKDFGIIWSTVRTDEGELYFDAYDRIFLFEDDTMKVIRPDGRFFLMHRPASRPIVEDRKSGLFRLLGTEKEYLKGSRELLRGKNIRSILPSAENGGEWTILTEKEGLYHYDPEGGEVRSYPDEPGFHPQGGWSSAGVYTACRMDPEKNPYGAAFAVGTTRKGLYLLTSKGRIALHLGKEEGLPAKQIWEVVPSKGGDLWAATNNGITLVHTGLPFTIALEGEGFSGSFSDIERASDPNSPLFLATTQGTWSWEEGRDEFALVPGTEGQCQDLVPLPVDPGSVLSGQRERKGRKPSRILAAGGTAGVFSIELSSEKMKADTVLSRYARSLAPLPFRKRKGVLPPVLAGGRNGLYVLAPEMLNGKRNGAPLLALEDVPEGIYMVGAERTGEGIDSLRLWASMRSQGVLKVMVDTAFTGHRITHYDTADGLPAGPVRIFPDPDGQGVMFGTKSGLYAFEKGRFVASCRYGKIFCDGSHEVFLLEKGFDNGEVWIGDSKGGQVKHFFKDEDGQRIDSTCFRGLDIGGVRAIHPEADRVWIGGGQGLASYFPEVEDDHDRAWDCLLRKVTGSGDSLLFGGNKPLKDIGKGDGLELPYAKNRLEFRYAAPFTDKQEEVTYSYRLVGFDTAWSKWSEQTRKEYTNLPEGDYTFRVKAKNVYGIESSTGTYSFTVLPPWYRTWTAYGGYMGAGIGFIWVLIWLYSRRLVAQKQRLEGIVEQRTQEIREKNQRLESANQKIEAEKEKVLEQKQEVERAHEALEESHKEITASIDYARKIQHALLQSEEYVSGHLPEHFILFKPQATVSGDFYWAKEQGGHLYFAAIDCTGHGVPGAFMSMLGISQLNEIMAAKELPTPGEVLTELRERVVAELRSGDPEGGAKDGMDAAMVKVPLAEAQDPNSNSNSKKIEFAGANNPLYVVKEGIGEGIPDVHFKEGNTGNVGTDRNLSPSDGPSDRINPFKKTPDGFEVKGDKMAVGYEPDSAEAFTTAELEVPTDAMLYMFSDGYADQFGGPKGKKFRYGPFKELLARIHTMSSEEQKEELDRVFEEWKESQEQVDDVCVVGVRV